MKWIISIILTVKLYLLFTNPLGIGTDQAIYGISENWLYLLGWGLQVITVFNLFRVSSWAGIIASVNPWLNSLALFNLPAIILVTLVSFIRNKKIFFIIVIIWSFWLIQKYPTFIKNIKFDALGNQINEIQRINFLATQKSYHLPSVVRKIIYHKIVFAADSALRQTISIFDFEHWTAPLSAWAITKMSGIPPRDILPLFYYWEIPLIVLSLYYFTKKTYLLFLIPIILIEKKFLWISGAILLPIVIIASAKYIQSLSKYWQIACGDRL